jgi:hypothetical protein
MSVGGGMPRVVDNGGHDFDFIFGDWHLRNRKLADVTETGSWT